MDKQYIFRFTPFSINQKSYLFETALIERNPFYLMQPKVIPPLEKRYALKVSTAGINSKSYVFEYGIFSGNRTSYLFQFPGTGFYFAEQPEELSFAKRKEKVGEGILATLFNAYRQEQLQAEFVQSELVVRDNAKISEIIEGEWRERVRDKDTEIVNWADADKVSRTIDIDEFANFDRLDTPIEIDDFKPVGRIPDKDVHLEVAPPVDRLIDKVAELEMAPTSEKPGKDTYIDESQELTRLDDRVIEIDENKYVNRNTEQDIEINPYFEVERQHDEKIAHIDETIDLDRLSYVIANAPDQENAKRLIQIMYGTKVIEYLENERDITVDTIFEWMPESKFWLIPTQVEEYDLLEKNGIYYSQEPEEALEIIRPTEHVSEIDEITDYTRDIESNAEIDLFQETDARLGKVADLYEVEYPELNREIEVENTELLDLEIKRDITAETDALHDADMQREFNAEVYVFGDTEREQSEFEAHLESVEDTGRVQEVFDASMDSVEDGPRLNVTHIAHQNDVEDGLRLETVVDTVQQDIESIERIPNELDARLDSIEEYITDKELDAQISEPEEYTKPTIVDGEMYGLDDGIMSAIYGSISTFNYGVKLSDIIAELEGISLSERHKEVLSTITSDNLFDRHKEIDSLFEDIDEGTRLRIIEALNGEVEGASREMTFDVDMAEPNEGNRDVTMVAQTYESERSEREMTYEAVYTEPEDGTREAEFDGDIAYHEHSERITGYEVDLTEQDEGLRDATISDAVVESFEPVSRKLIQTSIIDFLERYTSERTFETEMSEQSQLDLAGKYALVDEFNHLERDKEPKELVIDGQNLVTRLDVDAIIDSEDSGTREHTHYVQNSLLDQLDRIAEHTVIMSELDDLTRDKIASTKVIKKNSGTRKDVTHKTRVSKTEKSSRKSEIKKTQVTKTETTSRVEAIHKAKVTKTEKGDRQVTRNTNVARFDYGIRNVLNTATLIKSILGDRDSSHSARIIDKGGDSSLKEKEKKDIWLIQGKMSPWSPWNWKKTR